MNIQRRLIVNADDFGLSPGVNRGVTEAHERGIVTSTSCMVRGEAIADAAAYGRDHPSLSIGLHVDLGEWTFTDEAWRPLYEVVSLNDAQAVEAEVARQLEAFRRWFGREPTHLDSHQHVHLREPARSVLAAIARRLEIRLRHVSSVIRYCGEFYGQTTEGLPIADAISVDGILRILGGLRAGITELACHPAAFNDLPATMYSHERVSEFEVLCDPQVRESLPELGIELCSFANLAVPRTAEKDT
jgi:chitin disaccharide deacetylase